MRMFGVMVVVDEIVFVFYLVMFIKFVIVVKFFVIEVV